MPRDLWEENVGALGARAQPEVLSNAALEPDGQGMLEKGAASKTDTQECILFLSMLEQYSVSFLQLSAFLSPSSFLCLCLSLSSARIRTQGLLYARQVFHH